MPGASQSSGFRPVRDLYVIEWCESPAGAFAGKILAALGGDVVKVEPPGGRDDGAAAGLHLYLDHAKRSVTLDLAATDGLALFLELASGWADVIVLDRSVDAARYAGVDLDELRAIRPQLITACVTPFGDAPDAPRHVYPSQGSYYNGGAYLQPTGFLYEDSPNKAPVRLPANVPEYSVGLQVALAVLAAAWARRGSGTGQHIDISKQEAGLHPFRSEVDSFPNDGAIRTRQSAMPKPYDYLPGAALSGTMPCADGFVTMWLLEGYMPGRLASYLGNPRWADDRFRRAEAGDPLGAEHRGRIVEEFRHRTKDELYLGLQAEGVAAAPVSTPPDVLSAPQLEQRQSFETVQGADAGLRMPRLPFHVSGAAVPAKGRAPRPGEHNEDIICGILGRSLDELARLRAAGVK